MTPHLSLSQYLGWVFSSKEPDIESVPAVGLRHYPHKIMENHFVNGEGRSRVYSSLGFVKGSYGYLLDVLEVSAKKFPEHKCKLINRAYQEQVRYRLRHCNDYMTPDWSQKYKSIDNILALSLQSLEDNSQQVEWKPGKPSALKSITSNYQCYFKNETNQPLEISLIQMNRRGEGSLHFRQRKKMTRVICPSRSICTTLIIPDRETTKTSYVAFMILVAQEGTLAGNLEDLYNYFEGDCPQKAISGGQWACAKYWLKMPLSLKNDIENNV